jgi:single-stranded DNA-binding protein
MGNVTHEPHFRYVGTSRTPFLRLYLAVDHARDGTSFPRIVAYGDVAHQVHPYLQIGSKILVRGRYRQRKRTDKLETVHEFVVDEVVFVDNIDWERGNALQVEYASSLRE